MKFTQEQLSQIRKIYQDPQFKLVKDMFMDYLQPLIDIRNIDDKDNTMSVKGEIKAKKKFYELADKFFSDSEVLISSHAEQQEDYE